MGSAILSTDHTNVTLDNCIVASNTGSAPIACDPQGQLNVPSSPVATSTGTREGAGPIASPTSFRFAETSQAIRIFCDPANNVFTVRTDSPCAEQNNPLCGQIGAWEAACQPPADVEVAHDAPNALAPARVLPNPFTTTTSIVYSIPASVDAPLSLRIHDAQGRLVRELANGSVIAGSHAASLGWARSAGEAGCRRDLLLPDRVERTEGRRIRSPGSGEFRARIR